MAHNREELSERVKERIAACQARVADVIAELQAPQQRRLCCNSRPTCCATPDRWIHTGTAAPPG